jgi:hypothetical protein
VSNSNAYTGNYCLPTEGITVSQEGCVETSTFRGLLSDRKGVWKRVLSGDYCQTGRVGGNEYFPGITVRQEGCIEMSTFRRLLSERKGAWKRVLSGDYCQPGRVCGNEYFLWNAVSQ